MRTSLWTRINRFLQNARYWYEGTPDRALDQAYDAALMIKAIEDEHFGGNPISNRSGQLSANTFAYFQAELRKYLKITEIRLAEFKASRVVFNTTDPSASARSSAYSGGDRDRASVILEKLKFIDEIIDRYKPATPDALSLVPVSQQPDSLIQTNFETNSIGVRGQAYSAEKLISDQDDSILDKTGVLPRSIAGTLNRIKRDLDPKSEQHVVQSFRSNRAKTYISIRFLLLLIIVPLLTQQITKVFIVGPIVDHFRPPENSQIFINFELEEEALRELRTYEEKLKFQGLISNTPRLSEEEVNDRLKDRAMELKEEYSSLSGNAIKNVFADLFSLIAFAIIIATNRPGIAVLKSFIDETVYGLSDSAKAFIIILFTDMFVGFHSPHGWEVLLDGIARHLGLPSNHDFIFLFIATFPVILDTIFKYWIFRYLNRISPSAVATYKNMNE
ncbi:proton extrusion protein PcxA [Kovacikia minuta CCNUW1]|uniref:proton extrusion protein PcxA n=1 Tax=Kovacikia minuta TaxID=2931930 RepID=UPI001CC9BB23|nr:proton extrusion protein PcxA [Kovacikia minuta]UBF23763.1 proton extrusion protein PcxA [Kovacikia minuta CCNUW1]